MMKKKKKGKNNYGNDVGKHGCLFISVLMLLDRMSLSKFLSFVIMHIMN
jgi:hypothetical protein